MSVKINNSKTYKKYIYNFFLIPLFFLLSSIVKKDKKMVVLGSGFGYRFMGNPKYFYLYLIEKKDPDLIPLWITRNKELHFNMQKIGLPVVFLYSAKGLLTVVRAGLLIVAQSGQDIAGTFCLLGNFNIINTWHGNFVKDLKVSALIKGKGIVSRAMKFLIKIEQRNYILCLACSKFSLTKMMNQLSNPNIKVLGYPRNDIIFKSEYLNKENPPLGNLSYKKYKKVILYAPTFRDHTKKIVPFSSEFISVFNKYLKQKNAIFLYRHHPLDDGRTVIPKKSNIVDVSEIDDVQQVIAEADIIISDYSSIIADFSITDRPIIFFPYDYKSYKEKSRTMYFDYFKENIGPFAHNEKELFRLIKEVDKWFHTGSYNKKYLKFKNKFHDFKDGKSSERLYGYIKANLLE